MRQINRSTIKVPSMLNLRQVSFLANLSSTDFLKLTVNLLYFLFFYRRKSSHNSKVETKERASIYVRNFWWTVRSVNFQKSSLLITHINTISTRNVPTTCQRFRVKIWIRQGVPNKLFKQLLGKNSRRAKRKQKFHNYKFWRISYCALYLKKVKQCALCVSLSATFSSANRTNWASDWLRFTRCNHSSKDVFQTTNKIAESSPKHEHFLRLSCQSVALWKSGRFVSYKKF